MDTSVLAEIAPVLPARVGAEQPARREAAAPHAPVAAATRRRGREAVGHRLLWHMSPSAWAYFDFVLVALATWATHAGLLSARAEFGWVSGPLASSLTFGLCLTFAGLVFGLYERKTLNARSRIVVRSIMTVTLGLVLAHACIFLLLYGATTRWLGVLVAAIYAAVAIPVRLVAHRAITGTRRRVLCVGSGESLRKVMARLEHAHRPPVQIVGHVRVGGSASPCLDAPAATTHFVPDEEYDFSRTGPCLGTLDDIDAVLRDHAVDEVVIGPELRTSPGVSQAVVTCLDRRCRVTDQPTFVEKLLGEVPVEDVDAQWFLVADLQSSGGYEAVRRVLDVVVALVGLIVSLPLWLLIALCIRLDSRGPVFFTQRRVGLHGHEFTICKFRTMRVDAERDGARWADKNDVRVTPFGRFLRLSRLDELPQLWNILRGEMSLVGPRPERPEFVAELERLIPHYRQRHLVKPGLTGWAQIHFRYGATVDDARRKLCFDLYYLKHRSLDLDSAIIIRTIGTFLIGAR